MRLPSEIMKVGHQRFSKRAADLGDRQPFERFPWWLRLLSSLPLAAFYRNLADVSEGQDLQTLIVCRGTGASLRALVAHRRSGACVARCGRGN